jgi:hypothetical protein
VFGIFLTPVFYYVITLLTYAVWGPPAAPPEVSEVDSHTHPQG